MTESSSNAIRTPNNRATAWPTGEDTRMGSSDVKPKCSAKNLGLPLQGGGLCVWAAFGVPGGPRRAGKPDDVVCCARDRLRWTDRGIFVGTETAVAELVEQWIVADQMLREDDTTCIQDFGPVR